MRPRIMQEHQCQQTHDPCMGRQQRIEQPAQTNGFFAQFNIDQSAADRRGIAFGEDPIDYGE